MTAIAYMQQALVSNHSILADSYYNLGEVYRVIGQIDKAKEHFEISLSMNPNLTSAMYKLGVMRAMLQHRHTPCKHLLFLFVILLYILINLCLHRPYLPTKPSSI